MNIIRQHKSLPWEALDELRPLGRVEGGEVFEQLVSLTDEGETLRLRRVVVYLERAHSEWRNRNCLVD